jgi:hypothetical protein
MVIKIVRIVNLKTSQDLKKRQSKNLVGFLQLEFLLKKSTQVIRRIETSNLQKNLNPMSKYTRQDAYPTSAPQELHKIESCLVCASHVYETPKTCPNRLSCLQCPSIKSSHTWIYAMAYTYSHI